MDIDKKINIVENLIKIAETDNERKREIEAEIISSQITLNKIIKYAKEMSDMSVFFTDLDTLIVDKNKEFLEVQIDEALVKAFPIDNFNSLIELDSNKKGQYTAVLKIGKNRADYASIVFQNGDFMQQLVQFIIHESLLKINGSKVIMIDEGFNNGDENKYILIADFLDGLSIPYKAMIEHQTPIVTAMRDKNIITMYRDEHSNTVSIVKD